MKKIIWIIVNRIKYYKWKIDLIFLHRNITKKYTKRLTDELIKAYEKEDL